MTEYVLLMTALWRTFQHCSLSSQKTHEFRHEPFIFTRNQYHLSVKLFVSSTSRKRKLICCRTARLRGLFLTRLTPLITDPFRVVPIAKNIKKFYKTSKDINLKLNKLLSTAQTKS